MKSFDPELVKIKTLISCKWTNVLTLIIKNMKINDEWFMAFVDSYSKFPDLNRIDFSRNKITSKGFKYFVKNSHKFKRLFDLVFDNNPIENDGLKSFN